MSWPEISTKLDSYLRGRAAFCIVFRVLPSSRREPDLQFMGGATAFDQDLEALAANVKHAALMHYMAGINGISANPDPANQNPSDSHYWIVVIATGPAREAGYVVVMRPWAASKVRVEALIAGVQEIMRGEEAGSLPT